MIPVVLSGGADGVAALDFRVSYDPTVFEPIDIVAGAAATAAQKQVTGNAPSPGEYIVVMMGLNQTTVSQGEIAQLVLRQIGHPEEGVSRLTVLDTTLATWDGTELPSEGGTRVVRTEQTADALNAGPPRKPEPGEQNNATLPDVVRDASDGQPGRRMESLMAALAVEDDGGPEAPRTRGEASGSVGDATLETPGEPGVERQGLSGVDSAAQAREELIAVLPVPGSAEAVPGTGQEAGYGQETAAGADLRGRTSTQTVEMDMENRYLHTGAAKDVKGSDSSPLLMIAGASGTLILLGLAAIVWVKFLH